MKKLISLSLLSVVTASILCAQDTTLEIDSVTVTANKVEENILDVPQSITVLNAEILEEKGIRTVEDIIREIPNMTSIPDRGVKVNFRGLNASLFTANNPIVVYIDGIPTSYKRAFNASLKNVERIEVLRGPQGTLYGKDAIGGIIHIVTKEPINEISGDIGVEYGSNNHKRADFNVNVPIVKDKLFLNVNAEISSTDGWVTNTYNNDDKAAKEENESFGASLYYKATDNLSTRLVVKKEDSKDYGFKGYGIVGDTGLDNFRMANAENTSFDMSILEENSIDSQSINIKYKTDNYVIDAVTVHRQADVDGTYDGDYTSGTVLDGSSLFNKSSIKSYSQEIRVSNNDTDSIRWVAGLYIDKNEKSHDKYGSNLSYNDGSNAYTYYSNTVSTIDGTTQAIFAQSMIPLDERFELTLGARYQKIKKEINLDAESLYTVTKYGGFDYYYQEEGSVTYNDEKTWNVFIPKLALNYKINDNLTSFASISKGYMPGGFNSSASSSNEEDNRFEPQESINYEIGVKGSLDNFIFSAAIFRMNIKDIHIYRQEASGSAINYYTDNAEKAHSQGIEFSFTYLPSDTIEVSGTVGIIQTEYDSYKAGDYDFSGNDIETTPSHTANLSIAYYHPTGFYARTDIKNQGAMYFYDDVDKDFLKEDGYTLVDAKIGYKFSDWDTYIYGKNLTNEEYINTYEANSYFSMATYGDQRFIGVGAKYTF